MKFLVNFTLTAEAGNKIEARPGGPGPIIGRIVERFKPETFYLSASAREGWIVANLDTPQVTELMVALTDMSGQHPRFSVVMAAQDFGQVAGAAIPAAKKLTSNAVHSPAFA